MFIDSYAVEKYCKKHNITMMEEHTAILRQIDEKQGLKEVLQLDYADPIYRKTLWGHIQKVHSNVIVVEKEQYYAQSYEYVQEKNMRKEQYVYSVFIINYKDDSLLNNLDLEHLRQKVAAGDKLVIATVK